MPRPSSSDWRDTEAGDESRAAWADYRTGPGLLQCPECHGLGPGEVYDPPHAFLPSVPSIGRQEACGRCEGAGELEPCPECDDEPAGEPGGVGESCRFGSVAG